MKKTLNFFAAAALVAFAAVACQKEQLSDSPAEGTESVTFTVQTDAAATKATADDDGLGAGLSRCLVAVYMKTGNSAEPYKLYDTPSTTKQDNEHYSFTVNLIRKQTYQIVVWADKGKYTVPEDLSSVTRIADDKACNSDAYDAFYASVPFTQGTTPSTAITAKRPFAQLNLITKDLREGFEPKDIELTYTAYTKFNPFDGTTSDPQTVIYTSATHHYATLNYPVPGENTVAMNYLFANDEQSVLNEVKLKATFTDAVELAVANVPVRRNYRTNIKGNLFTEQTGFTISVDSDWNTPQIDVEWVATVADANAALQAGKTNVAIKSVENNSAILIPETSNNIGISLPSGNTNAVTIKYETSSTSGQTPNLNVEAVNNTGNLVIEAPQSHVTLNGVAYNSVTASTSNTTLVVESGVTINTLTINAGGLEIHGTVTELVIAEGADVVVRDCEGLSQTVYNVARNFLAPGYVGTQTTDGKWNIALSDYWIERVVVEPDGFVKDDASKTIRISTPEGLAWLSRNTQTKSNYYAGYTILLDNNIDLEVAYWTPIKMWSPENKTSFDGQGHTISNLKLKGSSTNDLSLFGSCAMNIKNFILDGVTITGANGYTGAVVGHLYGDLEKITVKNANITGSYWGIGGIVGFHNSGNMTDCHVIDSRINGGCPGGLTGVYNETADRVYSNCSAENVILHDTSCWGAPYLYGSIIAVVNCEIEFVSCSSSNMTYIFGSNEPYHSGDEGMYSTAPAHRLFGDASELEIIIDGETFVQQ